MRISQSIAFHKDQIATFSTKTMMMLLSQSVPVMMIQKKSSNPSQRLVVRNHQRKAGQFQKLGTLWSRARDSRYHMMMIVKALAYSWKRYLVMIATRKKIKGALIRGQSTETCSTMIQAVAQRQPIHLYLISKTFNYLARLIFLQTPKPQPQNPYKFWS